MTKRVFLIVLDSLGIGNAPDAKIFGDEGSNTLKTISKSEYYHTPNMLKLGLGNIDGVDYFDHDSERIGVYARLEEASMGKDTTIGHWEMAGIISKNPLPTYPEGFPKEVLDEFIKRTGREIICNKPYSGTDVIRDYGKEHIETGKLIVYTSADSVFQIAAHEDIVPIDELYKYCEIAREILQGEHGVGRVIARPFIGSEGNFTRTGNRHDFSLLPADNMLDALVAAKYETYGIGKIYDIFAGKGVEHTQRTKNNIEGMEKSIELLKKDFTGLGFINLVDGDMIYGHRRDIDGYAKSIAKFDDQLGTFISKMNDNDIVMITADHGCDPGYKGTDHTRECVLFLAYGKGLKKDINLGTRKTYADIAATILDIFNIENTTAGISFKKDIM
jgi:phosphopentomutase